MPEFLLSVFSIQGANNPQANGLILFIQLWAACYLVLAGLYLLVGCLVTWLNRTAMAGYRIQSKDCPDNLIKRDFWQSLKSLITIAAMLSASLSLRANGYSVFELVDFGFSKLTWLNALLWAALSLVLFDTWFYWAHRAIHQKRLYVRIHRWHHRSTTPTVWANNSDTFLDNIFCQSYWFVIPLILPIPTAVLVLHKIYDQVTGMIGHAGHEYAAGAFSAKPSPMIGTSFHDLHHSAFHYNFATHFSVWDRLMGTLHPVYDKQILAYPHAENPSYQSAQASQTTAGPEGAPDSCIDTTYGNAQKKDFE